MWIVCEDGCLLNSHGVSCFCKDDRRTVAKFMGGGYHYVANSDVRSDVFNALATKQPYLIIEPKRSDYARLMRACAKYVKREETFSDVVKN